MRVLCITDKSDRVEVALFQGLAQSGLEVEVLGDLPEHFQKNLSELKIPYREIKIQGRVDPLAILALRRILNKNNYDIVHAFTSRGLSNVLLAGWGNKFKCIGYRGTMGHVSWFDPGSWLTHLNPGLDHIMCVSGAVKDYLQGVGVPGTKLSVIYKGHSIEWYKHEEVSLLSYGIPKGAFVVGSLANMRPIKGMEVVLEAASLLLSEYAPNQMPHFLLVGEVRDLSLCNKASSLSHYIHMPGFIADAWKLMGNCNVFVMPSLGREGLPKALLEAMAQGVPCIASSVGGIPEVIRDGEDGILVAPGDARALVEAIKKLALDFELRRKLGDAAKEKVKSSFNVGDMVDRVRKLYQRITSLSQ